MPDEIRIPVNAKIPKGLHNSLLGAVEAGSYKDKTACITEALEKILYNTQEETQDNTLVLQEKENEIQKLQSEIQVKYAVIQNIESELQNYKNVIQNKDSEIHRLQSVIQEAPDPLALVKLQERNEGLNLLIEEKNRRIEDLTKYKEDIGIFANYFKSKEPLLIESPAAERKKPFWKFW